MTDENLQSLDHLQKREVLPRDIHSPPTRSIMTQSRDRRYKNRNNVTTMSGENKPLIFGSGHRFIGIENLPKSSEGSR